MVSMERICRDGMRGVDVGRLTEELAAGLDKGKLHPASAPTVATTTDQRRDRRTLRILEGAHDVGVVAAGLPVRVLDGTAAAAWRASPAGDG
jgi:hypothetical protein